MRDNVIAMDSLSRPSPGPLSGKLRLLACPRCGYSLEGLPTTHSCPECGFEYDDQTFVLTGISRGTSSLGTGRKWLWVIVGLVGYTGSNLFVLLLIPGSQQWAVLAGAALWIGLVAYLVSSSKRERQGIETFLFTAGGFGYVADMTGQTSTDARLFTWHEADTVLVDRKSSQWYRVRIGQGDAPLRHLHRTLLDVGIRCNADTAAWIEHTLSQRIAAARGSAPN